MQLNIQDLQTVKYYNLPIKIFIINNHVYGAILEFQDPELEGRYEATDFEHGYSHPNFEKIAIAYGINYYQISCNDELKKINNVLDVDGAVICEIMVDPNFRVKFPVQSPDKKLKGSL